MTLKLKPPLWSRRYRLRLLFPLLLALTATLFAQDIKIFLNGIGGKPALAVIDFRGSGSQPFMAALPESTKSN